MKVGARIMLFLSLINFIQLIINGSYEGGKVNVEQSAQSIFFQIILITFLLYMSFRQTKQG